MTVGDFTKREADEAMECARAIWQALSKKRQAQLPNTLGRLICFLEAAKKAAPSYEGADA